MSAIKFLDEPGSPAWHQRRARAYNAGDAAAMLGCSTNKTRTEFLDELHTGIEREFSDYVQQRVIDPGHAIEAAARPVAEEIIGEDLQVAGYTLECGLSRPLGASLDGVTFLDDTNWECKSLNEALREALPHVGRDSAELNDAANLPKMYRVQMEQQMLVNGAGRTLFTAANIDAQGNITEERHAWYSPDLALRAEIRKGWMQLDADRATHVPAVAKAVVVAQPVESLPLVTVQVEGTIAIEDNFDVFEVALRNFLEHRLIRTPSTDQEFADLDLQIKAMKGAEAALDNAESNWTAQIDAVAVAKRRKDMLHKLVRDNRLMAEKLLTSEKERRKGEIVAGGVAALRDHCAKLVARLGRPYLPSIAADFAGAIKGMRSLDSMENAVATALAHAKIEANDWADRIELNLRHLNEHAAEHMALFPDVATAVLKPADDFKAVVTARIAEHRARLHAEAEQAAERQRERIRREEQERANREAHERLQKEREQQAQVGLTQAPGLASVANSQRPAANGPASVNVVPLQRATAAAPVATSEHANLTLGAICARFPAGLTMTAAFVRDALGVQGSPGPKAGTRVYSEADYQRILVALGDLVASDAMRRAA